MPTESGALLAGDGATPAAEPYEILVARVLEAVAHTVPDGATVLVASRGDDDLLRLAGDRRGWHFPQGERGVYAGHYPAGSAEAIAHLEHLRDRGATHLVLPRTASWWLDHYAEFGEHLRSRYPSVAVATDSCVIFRLGGKGGSRMSGPTDAGEAQRGSHVRVQLARLADSILPLTATVLVAVDSDGEATHVGARRVLPLTTTDVDGGGVAALEEARAVGADYLVIPATALSRVDRDLPLRRRLAARHRLVARQEQLGEVYEIAAAPEPADG